MENPQDKKGHKTTYTCPVYVIIAVRKEGVENVINGRRKFIHVAPV